MESEDVSITLQYTGKQALISGSEGDGRLQAFL